MADSSVDVTPGSGASVDTRTEGTNGNHRQVMVIGDPATNAGVAPVDGTAGLKVDLGADNDVTVTSGSITANAGTNLNTSALALESGGNLAAVAASASVLDDWDESDRAKVNLIAGQAGITAGAGSVAANTPRVTHASDDPVTTSVQLIDDAIVADDAAFTPATTKVMMAGFEFDDTSPDSVNEGDAGAARMSANRNIYVTLRDAAGNERGLNVSAAGTVGVTVASGGVASGAVASGAFASGALASGSIAAGAIATGATSIAANEDDASANLDTGVKVMFKRLDTPANSSGTDGDYEQPQMSAGRIWTSAKNEAGELHLGEVGGMTAVRAVTLSTDTSAYASGDVIATTQQIDGFFRKTDGTGVINSISIIDEDNQGAAIYVIFMDTSTSLGTENSAPNISDANLTAGFLGIVAVATTDYVTLSGTKVATIRNIGLPVKAASGTDDLYIAVLNGTGTPTYTASGLEMRIGVLLD